MREKRKKGKRVNLAPVMRMDLAILGFFGSRENGRATRATKKLREATIISAKEIRTSSSIFACFLVWEGVCRSVKSLFALLLSLASKTGTYTLLSPSVSLCLPLSSPVPLCSFPYPSMFLSKTESHIDPPREFL